MTQPSLLPISHSRPRSPARPQLRAVKRLTRRAAREALAHSLISLNVTVRVLKK